MSSHVPLHGMRKIGLYGVYLAAWSVYSYFWAIQWSYPTASSGWIALGAGVLGAVAAGWLVFSPGRPGANILGVLVVGVLLLAALDPLLGSLPHSSWRLSALTITQPFPVLSVVLVPIMVACLVAARLPEGAGVAGSGVMVPGAAGSDVAYSSAVRFGVVRFGGVGHLLAALACVPAFALLVNFSLFLWSFPGGRVMWWDLGLMEPAALFLAGVAVTLVAANQLSAQVPRGLSAACLSALAVVMFLSSASQGYQDSIGIGGTLVQLLAAAAVPVLLILVLVMGRPQRIRSHAAV